MKIVKYNSSTATTSSSSSNGGGYGGFGVGGNGAVKASLDMHYIFGQPFNGTQDVSGDLTANNVYANGDVTVSGSVGANGDVTVSGSVTASGDVVSSGTVKGIKGNFDTLSANTATTKQISSDKGNIKSLESHDITSDAISSTTGTFDSIIANKGSYNSLTALTAYIKALSSDNIVTDNLTVTKAAHFFRLIIDEIKSVGGSVILTTANAELIKVETLSSGDYRCYFKATDGDKQIDNQFVNGDQVVCMTFNVAEGDNYDVSNKYYWRLVTGVSSKPIAQTIGNGTQSVLCHYIDLSATDKDSSSNGVPEAYDKIAQLGSRNDKSRQNAILISAYQNIDKELQAPSIAQYKGINTYELSKHRKTTISPNNNLFTGKFSVVSSDDGSETDIEDLVAGVEIASQKDFFILSDRASGITNTSQGWTEKSQVPTKDKPYLWKFTRTTYKNGTVIDSTAFVTAIYNQAEIISISDDGYWVIGGQKTNDKAIGDDGHSPYIGDDGYWYVWDEKQGKFVSTGIKAKGSDGSSVTITSTSVNYAVSSQGSDSTKVTGWQSTIPTITDTNPYLWTRTIVNYSDGKSTTSYSVSYKGKNGQNGSSVTITSTGVTYQISNNGTTVPTGSWSTTIPKTTDQNPYLWTRTIVNYSDGKSTTSYSVSYKGKDGKTPTVSISSDGYWVINGTTTTDKATGDDGHDPYIGDDGFWYTWDNTQGKYVSTGIKAQGDKGDNITITKTETAYQISNSGTQVPTGTWTTGTTIPQATDQQPYLWTRVTITYSDKTTTTSYSVSYKGKDGTSVTITSTGVTYQISSDGTTIPTGTWSTTIPKATDQQPYLWTRTIVNYSDGKSTTSYSVSYKGKDGTSVTITSTGVTYQISDSGTKVPTGTWYSTIQQTTDSKPYLWTRTIVNYSDGKSTTSYSVSYKGKDGASGKTPTYFEIKFIKKTLEVVFKNGSTTYPNGALVADIKGIVNYVEGDKSTPKADMAVIISWRNAAGNQVSLTSLRSDTDGLFSFNKILQEDYHTLADTSKIAYAIVSIL